ncbi:MAG: DUF2490 domain-containing protein [Bacteroidetes bacterium]|nr:MAG: DUF2490 domain-containing protein [Bacteroidota bacterium]
MCSVYILLAGLVLSSNLLCAQHTYRIGWLPQVNLNYKVNDQWRLNGKVESRPALASGQWGDALAFEYSLTDLSLQAAYKFHHQQTLSGGYLWRIRPDEDHHRLIQQYSLVHQLARFRLGHRFAADQTFRPRSPLEVRLRYRLSVELPLSGTQVDAGELYLKVNHEYLNAFQGSDYELEVRLVPVVGYLLTDRNKWEMGFDARLDGFLNQATRWTLWWAMAWYYSW